MATATLVLNHQTATLLPHVAIIPNTACPANGKTVRETAQPRNVSTNVSHEAGLYHVIQQHSLRVEE